MLQRKIRKQKMFLSLCLSMSCITNFGVAQDLVYQSHTLIYLNEPEAITAIDIDNDGDIDLVTTSHINDEIDWHENDGAQSFITHRVGTSNNVDYIDAKDVDGDGNIDIIASDNRWFKNDGNQNFTQIDEVHSHGITKYDNDIDGDGDIDKVPAHQVTGTSNRCGKIYTTHWLVNDGTYHYGYSPEFLRVTNPYYHLAYAIDIDKDSNVDILYSTTPCLDNDDLYLFHNDGGQNFSKITIASDIHVKSMYPKDINNDGKIDIVTSSVRDENVVAYLQRNNAVFESYIVNKDIKGYGGVYAIDLDNDCDIDILSVSRQDNKVIWNETIGNENDECKKTKFNIVPIINYLLL